jgi:hypothetical protein
LELLPQPVRESFTGDGMKGIPESGWNETNGFDAFSAAVQEVYGRDARKRLARDAGVSPDTVKGWLSGRWPASRQRQIAELLLVNIEGKQAMLRGIQERVRLILKGGVL